MKKQFRSFEDARKFVHTLNLKSGKYWKEYCKSDNKPGDIPNHPIDVYKKYWKGMGDWLGTGTIAPSQRKYLSFEDTKKYARKLNFKNKEQWYIHARSGKLPKNIPRNPQTTLFYKKEWNGWENFLGKKTTSKKYRKILDFNDARKFVHSLRIKGQREWGIYSKSGKKPDNIPANPSRAYENWNGWQDWLGWEITSKKYRKILDFNDARKFVHSLNLKTGKEWDAYCKSGNKPDDIPPIPHKTYVTSGWNGMPDWLGNGFVPQRFRKYRSFLNARKFVHSLKIKTKEEWTKYTKSTKRPEDIPTNPPRTYKDDWVSWENWLGSGIISPRNKSKMWLPWKDAKPLYRKIAKENNITSQTQWAKFVKTHKLPKGLPPYPEDIYTKERFRKQIHGKK